MGFFDNLTKSIRESLQGDVDGLMKADANLVPDNPEQPNTHQGAIGGRAVINDPYFDQASQHFIFKNKMTRLSNKTLKDTSIRDWVVSAIIQARIDTMLRFSRPQRKQFDMGFKIQKKDQTDITPQEREEMSNLEDFIYHCGRKDKVPPGEEMLFGEFLKLTTRDAVTFGHIAVEKILTRKGGLHRFRPLPGESVYLINQKTSRDIIQREVSQARTMRDRYKEYSGNNDPSAHYEFNEPEIDYYKYVQMSYDNRVLAAFGDQDMVFHVFNPQNFSDSMGYGYSPLELAILNITTHLNVENYNSLFFTHGYASRGILHLKGTVTQANLAAFRRQFHATISGTQNAWRTPIVAGLDDVQWVPISGTAKEMEYLNYNNHVMRAMCTQFQIDPVELGLDYLISGSGKAPMQQANNEYKITYSRERGLIPVLMMFEDLINSKIIPALDVGLAQKYEFKFTGYDDESPQTNIALQQAEMTVHSSMNDLLRAADKTAVKHPAYDVPLNQTFWAIVEKNMTKGEIRETFFGDKGATTRRELQYIPGDPMYTQFLQLLMTMDQKKRMDAMEAQQMKAQQEQAQAENQRQQEQHDHTMDSARNQQAHAAVQHQSLQDVAKQMGAATQAVNVGGTSVANPLNQDLADE